MKAKKSYTHYGKLYYMVGIKECFCRHVKEDEAPNDLGPGLFMPIAHEPHHTLWLSTLPHKRCSFRVRAQKMHISLIHNNF